MRFQQALQNLGLLVGEFDEERGGHFVKDAFYEESQTTYERLEKYVRQGSHPIWRKQ